MRDKDVVSKALMKIDIVKGWYFDKTGGEYVCTNQSAQALVEKLEEVE